VFIGFADGSILPGELLGRTDHFAWYFVYLAGVEFVSSYICTVGFYWSGERIVRRLRRTYLEAIVRQNISFFDIVSIGQLTTHITSDMIEVQEALTSKSALALTAAANFLSAFAIAFIMNPRLALILCSILVAMILVTMGSSRFAVKNSKISKNFYSIGSNVAHEAISNIKHVVASNSQNQWAEKYEKIIRGAEKYGIKSRVYMAVAFGWSSGMPNWAYALGFWAGVKYFLSRGDSDVAAVVATTITVVNGAFAMLRVIPLLESFVASMSSLSATFKIIHRRSAMDPFASAGLIPDRLTGNIELENVEVVYPSRRQTKALKSVTISIPASKTTALVGLSGCGKSTILSLLERFYEPTEGSIRVDGIDLADLNLYWWRKQMAYVGQEPTLFNATIFENIRHGLISSATVATNDEEDRERVIAAARAAYAHDFIMALPRGYDTELREKGHSLSGGQRQRIAIARAIVSDPKILLLDEATAALDTHSEKVIQKALESASRTRTTIVIAHRLSTIRNADNIVVMQAGEVVEQGNHDELLAQRGFYAELIYKHQLRATTTEPHTKDRAYSEETEDYSSDDDLDDIELQELVKNGAESVKATSSADEDLAEHNGIPSVWRALWMILHLNRPERWYLCGGIITSLLASVNLIIPAIWYANTLNAFSLTNAQEMMRRTDFWTSIFAITGIYGFIVGMLNGVFFAVSTEKLARRVRDATLRAILRQNIGYFDEKAHDLIRMASKLSSSATDLMGLSGIVIGNIVTFSSTIALALGIGLGVAWKLSLFCLPLVPILAALGWVRLKVIMVFDGKIRQAGEEAAAYAGEVVGAIRVVASAGLERYVLDRYSTILAAQAAQSLGPILRTSALYAASQGINFLASAFSFWYGSFLLAQGEYTLTQYYICLIALVWGAAIAGALFNFAPNMSKAALAAYELKRLFERTPEIDSWSQRGKRVSREDNEGHIAFENVSFVYPSSPQTMVLRHINLEIPVGKFVAIVGGSGSGKSTVLALLERFYDPTYGRITLDGQDIRDLHLNSYRQMISLVSQEPAVFSGTIRENLMMGQDAFELVSEEQLHASCRAANIHDFITSLPEGYNTQVGAGGSMLSGGQKQRLAIARALLRDSPILLLDEATSALDNSSEKIVLTALEATRQGRTIVAIAHRLATIQHADIIYVLDKGRLVEQGSHSALLRMHGVYHALVQSQGL
jgi:ATP-binding cassette subfamily B (MDR/TAP) protein 1